MHVFDIKLGALTINHGKLQEVLVNKHEFHSSSPLYPGWGSKYSVSWRTTKILHAADGAVILAVRLLKLYPVPLSWNENGRL